MLHQLRSAQAALQFTADDGHNRCHCPALLQPTLRSPIAPRRATLPHHARHRHRRLGHQGHAARRRRQAGQRARTHPYAGRAHAASSACACSTSCAHDCAGFDRVSVGFPGVVKRGITYDRRQPPSPMGTISLCRMNSRNAGRSRFAWPMTPPCRATAPSRATAWSSSHPRHRAWARRSLPTASSAQAWNSATIPGAEKTYEDYLGRRGLDKYGKKQWNKLLQEAIAQTAASSSTGTTSTWAAATPKRSSSSSHKNVSIVSNEDGIFGGVALWREASK